MPQLDFSTFPSQIFWLAIVFILLYVLMARVGLPRVGSVIERRKAKINHDLERAQTMKTEAEAVMAAYERTLADAQAQAQATLRETVDRFNAESAARQNEAGQTLAAEAGAAEQRIAAAKSDALANLRSVAIEVARAASARLIGVEVDDAQMARAVDQVIDASK